jgi:Spy/CpxP family protein refolding chaperone
MRKMMLPLMMLLASAPAFAQSGGDAGATVSAERRQAFQQKMDERVSALAAKLGLDAAGTAALRQTFTRYQAQLAPLRRDSWQTRKALKQELANPQPDRAKLQQLADELTSNRQKMAAINDQRLADLRSQLTPEQYAKLVASRPMGGRMHHWGRGGHHGHGPGAAPVTPEQ